MKNSSGPLISVIMPVYNTSAYITEALNTILSQTIQNIEIICVNDCSPDSSLDVLCSYAEKDSRIRIIDQKENRGAGFCRNAGIKVARGEYLAFIDSDDLYPEDGTLELLYSTAKMNNVLICGGEMLYFRPGDKVYRSDFPANQKYTYDREGIIEYRDYQFDYGYTRFIYSRKFIVENKILFPCYSRYEDPPFFVKAMALASKFYALKRPTYVYRWGHKEVVWDAKKTEATFRGFQDVWNIAMKYSLSELKNNTFNHIRDNMYRLKSTMTAEHKKFAFSVECEIMTQSKSWYRRLFSKLKSSLDSSYRIVSIFGIKIIYQKKKSA